MLAVGVETSATPEVTVVGGGMVVTVVASIAVVGVVELNGIVVEAVVCGCVVAASVPVVSRPEPVSDVLPGRTMTGMVV